MKAHALSILVTSLFVAGSAVAGQKQNAPAGPPSPTAPPQVVNQPQATTVISASELAPTEPRFWLGPSFGVNASTFLCDSCDSAGVRGRAGISSGMVAEMLIGSHMAVEFESMYLQKGAVLRSGGVKVGQINYETIEVPVSFKGRFGSKKVHAVVFGGPQIGFAVTRSIEQTGSATHQVTAGQVDFGVHGGGGVEFTFGDRTTLFLNARVNVGLVNLDDGSIGQSTTSFGVLGLSGIKFGI